MGTQGKHVYRGFDQVPGSQEGQAEPRGGDRQLGQGPRGEQGRQTRWGIVEEGWMQRRGSSGWEVGDTHCAGLLGSSSLGQGSGKEVTNI